MAKGFLAEATNEAFMPAQAIEMPRVRTTRPKIKSKKESIWALMHGCDLTSPHGGPHTQTTSMLRQATTATAATAVSTRALCAVAVSGLGIVLLILPH